MSNAAFASSPVRQQWATPKLETLTTAMEGVALIVGGGGDGFGEGSTTSGSPP